MRLNIAAACLLLVSACGQTGTPVTGPVALTVNDEAVSLHQVDLAMQRDAAGTAERDANSTHRVLDAVVEQELAVQAARQAGLERDPRVLQAIEAARREVLAKAFRDKLAELAHEPSSDDVDRYYEAHPLLFAQRRQYQLQETTVTLPAERIAALMPRLHAAGTPAQLAESLRGESSTVRLDSVMSEELPEAQLERLAALKDGQSLVLPAEGGLRVLTVLSSQAATVPRRAARRAIAAQLVEERKALLVQQGMTTLRARAKVAYHGRFAALKGAAVDESASASSPIAR